MHTLFFYIFILTFPFNIRKAFLSDHSYFTGHFVEDATYFLNLSDIFLFLTLFFALVYIVKNDIAGDFFKFIKKYKNIFLALGLLIVWSGISVFYVKDSRLAFFGAIKLLEFGLLFLYIAYFLRDHSKLFMSWMVIAAGGLIQAFIALAQYIKQESIGLNILGESIIGKDLSGVAKILVDGEKVVRPYGTFGHPNILGGFLILSLAVNLALYLSFKESNKRLIVNIFIFLFAALLLIMFFDHYLFTNQQGQIILWLVLGMVFAVSISPFEKGGLRGILGDVLNPPNPLCERGKLFRVFGDRASRWLILSFIILQFIALILTYSRSAWLAFGLLVIGVTIFSFKNLVWKNWSKILLFFLTTIILSVLFLPIKTRISDFLDGNSQAIGDRVLGFNTAFKTIKKHPLTGVGNKNFVISIPEYENNKLEYWQYQPVHNGYLLVLSELGLIGFGLFTVFAFFVAAHNSISGREGQK